jgi:hypothetical protein
MFRLTRKLKPILTVGMCRRQQGCDYESREEDAIPGK